LAWPAARLATSADSRHDGNVRRVPLLSGSRIVHVPLADDDVVLAPPPPSRAVDVAAAVRDALRFPLDGRPFAERAPRRGRVTVVVEPPSLPIPGAQLDARQEALATVLAELAAHGLGRGRQTILVAGGLARKLGRRDLERLLSPPQAREYRGHVLVHDAEDPELVRVDLADGTTARVHPALVESDLVVLVSSAETVVNGGPSTLLSACDATTYRRASSAESLLQAAGEPAWRVALALERAVAANVPTVGVSLVLDHPRLTGRFREYPYAPHSLEHVSRSPFRRLYSRLPASLRRGILRDQARAIAATAAYAGTPSVAHAEALIRTIELRGIPVPEPLDALVVGVPWIGPHVPRELLNPITSAATVLGLALRLWRDAFPIRESGTLVLVHSLTRTFAHGTQGPYRRLFDTLAGGGDVGASERIVSKDARALAAYRAGRACHPSLPYADWAGCQPALSRLGAVVVAGSRDAVAARALGFVPTHSISSALEIVHGLAGGRARVGVLLAPPYAPLLVGTG
jgi:Lactate racemase N-terminal domain